MLPNGYTGLIIANERRAREWQIGLQGADIDVLRVPTDGIDSERGSWQIGVAEADAVQAREYVSQVIRGELTLPRVPGLSKMGMRSLAAIGATMAALAVALLVGC